MVCDRDSDQPPKYTNSTDLSSRVGKLHPAWNEDDSAEVYYKGFLKAVELTGSEFLDSVNYFGKVRLSRIYSYATERDICDRAGCLRGRAG
jgi:hypothetical protein